MQKKIDLSAHRPNARGLPNLPLSVRATGLFCVDTGWGSPMPPRPITQLYWTISGRGVFRLQNQKVKVGKGDIFIYYPGEAHNPQAVSQEWTYCWVNFDHPEACRWISDLGLVSRHQQVGSCPEILFARLRKAVQEANTPENEVRTANLAHDLLLKAALKISEPKADSIVMEARRILDTKFSDSVWGVEELATELQVHRTTLFRHFLAHYGLTPSRYLQNLRIGKALHLLRESRLPIQNIAEQAGFAGPHYFSKAIKETTGMSPTLFRRS